MTLLQSTVLYHGSTWLYLTLLHYIIARPGCSLLYYTLPWLYYILPWILVTLLDSTTLYHGSTWLYYTISLLDSGNPDEVSKILFDDLKNKRMSV